MNTALTERSHENNDNTYGAVTFRQADSTSGVYDYTVHVGGDTVYATSAGCTLRVMSCFVVVEVVVLVVVVAVRDESTESNRCDATRNEREAGIVQ